MKARNLQVYLSINSSKAALFHPPTQHSAVSYFFKAMPRFKGGKKKNPEQERNCTVFHFSLLSPQKTINKQQLHNRNQTTLFSPADTNHITRAQRQQHCIPGSCFSPLKHSHTRIGAGGGSQTLRNNTFKEQKEKQRGTNGVASLPVFSLISHKTLKRAGFIL